MGNIEEQVELINDLKVLATEVEIPNPKAIRSIMDDFKSKLQDTIIVLVGQVDGKVSVIATVPKSLTNQVKAGDLIKNMTPLLVEKVAAVLIWLKVAEPNLKNNRSITLY